MCIFFGGGVGYEGACTPSNLARTALNPNPRIAAKRSRQKPSQELPLQSESLLELVSPDRTIHSEAAPESSEDPRNGKPRDTYGANPERGGEETLKSPKAERLLPNTPVWASGLGVEGFGIQPR